MNTADNFSHLPRRRAALAADPAAPHGRAGRAGRAALLPMGSALWKKRGDFKKKFNHSCHQSYRIINHSYMVSIGISMMVDDG